VVVQKLNPVLNGIGSDTTIGVLKRLSVYESIARCRAVVLAIGINDLARRSDQEIVENYKEIISAIPSNVAVVFSAILPVDERADEKLLGYNRRIREINEAARQFCFSSSRCRFINSGTELTDSSGNLAPEYHAGDGVHLNVKGYAVWIGNLRAGIDAVHRP